MNPLVFGIGLPLILFGVSLYVMGRCLTAKARTLPHYVWLGVYTMVFCLAGVWLAASLTASLNGQISDQRLAAMTVSGPPLFLSFLFVLIARVFLAWLHKITASAWQRTRRLLTKRRT